MKNYSFLGYESKDKKSGFLRESEYFGARTPNEINKIIINSFVGYKPDQTRPVALACRQTRVVVPLKQN